MHVCQVKVYMVLRLQRYVVDTMFLDFVPIGMGASEYFELLNLMPFPNANMLSIGRVLRLIRLMRVVRLLRLLEELRIPVLGRVSPLRILFWTVLMSILVLFSGAILMTETLGKSSAAPAEMGTNPSQLEPP